MHTKPVAAPVAVQQAAAVNVEDGVGELEGGGFAVGVVCVIVYLLTIRLLLAPSLPRKSSQLRARKTRYCSICLILFSEKEVIRSYRGPSPTTARHAPGADCCATSRGEDREQSTDTTW